jgi:Flp pilus assembly protein TadG
MLMLDRFHRDNKGLAAVEFALLLPVMITLFFGVVEVSKLLNARAAVVNVASVTADLVAQKSTLTGSDISNVFGAAAAILYPNSPAGATIEIYSIVDDGNKGAGGKVAWGCKMENGDPATAQAIVSNAVPTDENGAATRGGEMIKAANLDKDGVEQWGGSGSVIIGKITYTYSSPATKMVIGERQMISLFYARPRRVAKIAAPPSCS